MLNFGDFQVLLIEYTMNIKVEIVSDNIILENFYFWRTRRLTSNTYELFAKLQIILIPLLRKSMGTLEIIIHKIFHLTGNVSVDHFPDSVTVILNYSSLLFFLRTKK